MTIREGSSDRAVEPEPGDGEELLRSKDEFAREVREVVVDEAPQAFALVEEYSP